MQRWRRFNAVCVLLPFPFVPQGPGDYDAPRAPAGPTFTMQFRHDPPAESGGMPGRVFCCCACLLRSARCASPCSRHLVVQAAWHGLSARGFALILSAPVCGGRLRPGEYYGGADPSQPRPPAFTFPLAPPPKAAHEVRPATGDPDPTPKPLSSAPSLSLLVCVLCFRNLFIPAQAPHELARSRAQTVPSE